jgi:hypothetical protein
MWIASVPGVKTAGGSPWPGESRIGNRSPAAGPDRIQDFGRKRGSPETPARSGFGGKEELEDAAGTNGFARLLPLYLKVFLW